MPVRDADAEASSCKEFSAAAPDGTKGAVLDPEHVTQVQALTIETIGEIVLSSAQVTPQVTKPVVSAPLASRDQAARLPRASRSAVTNGSRMLLGVNGGSAAARRFRDLVNGLSRELGDELSDSDRLMIRNAAALQLHVEDLTSQLARGEPVDPEAFTRATNAATRAIGALRRRRPAKRRTTTLAEIAAEFGGRQ